MELRKMSKSIITLFFYIFLATVLAAGTLQGDFQTPPREAGVRCWWWWLNSNVTKEAITKDLEAMHEKGFSGAMIFDAGGADQRGNAQVPALPAMSRERSVRRSILMGRMTL